MEKKADAFRTISEVADELDLPQHVLRFWETRFPQIRPLKRAGGRRFYRPYDVEILRAIRRLLYGEGYTIKGVQRILKEHGARAMIAPAGTAEDVSGTAPGPQPENGAEKAAAGWTEDGYSQIAFQPPSPDAEVERRLLATDGVEPRPVEPSAADAGHSAGLEIIRRLSDILHVLEACERSLEAARRC
jgi:DNA-binding transcriptional MerR regulator